MVLGLSEDLTVFLQIGNCLNSLLNKPLFSHCFVSILHSKCLYLILFIFILNLKILVLFFRWFFDMFNIVYPGLSLLCLFSDWFLRALSKLRIIKLILCKTMFYNFFSCQPKFEIFPFCTQNLVRLNETTSPLNGQNMKLHKRIVPEAIKRKLLW